MYVNVNNTAYSTGISGYDTKVDNLSVRYGKNALKNHINYLNQYSMPLVQNPAISSSTDNLPDKLNNFINDINNNLCNMPPLSFKLLYMRNTDNNKIDKDSLMGASFEELGEKTALSLDEMNAKLSGLNGEVQICADALDLNKDGYIDIAENAASILLADALSTSDGDITPNNINGIISNEGQNRLLPYGNKKNYDIAYKTYASLYQYYNLEQAKNEFMQNKNNLVI